jgi:hypothetical protein
MSNNYQKSFQDQISDSLTPITRKLQNIRTRFLGTKAKALRIKQINRNAFGDKTFEYSSETIDNVIIQYPFSSVEMFNSKVSANTTAIDLLQYLPITMQIPFDELSNNELISGSAVMVNEDDIIVHVLFGHHKEKMPIVMKVTRAYGGFNGRNLIKRRYELSLVRGQEVDELQSIIDIYISGISQD